MTEIVIITGMSGAGRSTAADALEDLGWFVVDNLPPALISKVADLAKLQGDERPRVALAIGAGSFFDDLVPAIRELRTGGGNVKVVFLDASDDVLVRRFEGNRRRHPLEDAGLVDAVASERELLTQVKAAADLVIDTGDLNVHQLRERIVESFSHDAHTSGMRTAIMSFGYKHGIPLDVDLVLDCRFLPNPHWVPELRPQSGFDEPVREYVMTQPETGEFLDRLTNLLDLLLPAYVREGKSYLTIAVGCTGGRHRSVAIANELGERIKAFGLDPAVSHRDIDK